VSGLTRCLLQDITRASTSILLADETHGLWRHQHGHSSNVKTRFLSAQPRRLHLDDHPHVCGGARAMPLGMQWSSCPISATRRSRPRKGCGPNSGDKIDTFNRLITLKPDRKLNKTSVRACWRLHDGCPVPPERWRGHRRSLRNWQEPARTNSTTTGLFLRGACATQRLSPAVSQKGVKMGAPPPKKLEKNSLPPVTHSA